MSNYNWTENQIQSAIGRGNRRSQEDWLGVGIFNVKNKKDSQGKKADAKDYISSAILGLFRRKIGNRTKANKLDK